MSIAMESFTSERTGNLAIWRRTSSSYSALPVGGLAITTRRGGAILLTKDARLERVLNENTGNLRDAGYALLPGNAGPQALAADPAGKFLYVANATSSNISGFTISNASGQITPMPGSP